MPNQSLQPNPEQKLISTPRDAAIRGLKDAMGLPSLLLLAGMIGFGSLVRETGLGLDIALGATLGIYGLPGQLAFAEMYATGAGILSIALAVSLANARFLPLAVTFIPELKSGVKNRGWLYLLVQPLAVNSWAIGLFRFPQIKPDMRVYFYVFYNIIVVTAGVIGTIIGFYAVGIIPRPITLGFIYLNPLYFALLFASFRGRRIIFALLIGAFFGPLFHLVSSDWGILINGLFAGTLAFLLEMKFPGETKKS